MVVLILAVIMIRSVFRNHPHSPDHIINITCVISIGKIGKPSTMSSHSETISPSEDQYHGGVSLITTPAFTTRPGSNSRGLELTTSSSNVGSAARLVSTGTNTDDQLTSPTSESYFPNPNADDDDRPPEYEPFDVSQQGFSDGRPQAEQSNSTVSPGNQSTSRALLEQALDLINSTRRSRSNTNRQTSDDLPSPEAVNNTTSPRNGVSVRRDTIDRIREIAHTRAPGGTSPLSPARSRQTSTPGKGPEASSSASAFPQITFKSVPQWRWNNAQTCTWLAAYFIEKLDIEDAEGIASRYKVRSPLGAKYAVQADTCSGRWKELVSE